MAVDRHQLLRQQHRIAILLQRLAIALALDLGRTVQHRLHAAELHDQLHAALIADAGSAGNVVHCIAAQRHHVHNFFRRHAQRLRHLCRIENQIVFLRIQDLHLRRHQLHHVLVAGDDEDLVLPLRGLAGQRADHVVGLKTLGFQNRNAQRFKRTTDIGNLPAQVLGHGFAIGLVALVANLFEALRLRRSTCAAAPWCAPARRGKPRR